ncbi:MAG: hypothetical protein IPL52_03740 [Flavobacteriales bacterium]|nr:hypothetical protein [Flavobacteriales bacterium]
MQQVLDPHRAILLPGGAHPFYVPSRAGAHVASIPIEAHAIRASLFDKRGHAWSNDLALRLDVHFDKAAEFNKAHAALRLLMPLIPALAASSPIHEGRSTGYHSSRLDARKHASDRLPELMGGSLVPEAIFEPEEYDRAILGPIAQALGPHDPNGILDPQEMNARGVTVNFDRGTLTLHVIDAQECPSANMAIVELIIAVLKALVGGRWASTYLQRAWSAEDLDAILLDTIRHGDRAIISNRDYLLMFGLLQQDSMPALKLWQHLFVDLYSELGPAARTWLDHILEHGCLASRIMARIGARPSTEKLRTAYAALAECHALDQAFL